MKEFAIKFVVAIIWGIGLFVVVKDIPTPPDCFPCTCDQTGGQQPCVPNN